MTEVLFYHLQRQPIEKVLPNLLERSLERGWRAVVQASSEDRVDALDAHLWTFSDDSFLPHGTDREATAGQQPIVLTVGDLGTVAAIQHLLGLAIAVVLYAVVLRRGANAQCVSLAFQIPPDADLGEFEKQVAGHGVKTQRKKDPEPSIADAVTFADPKGTAPELKPSGEWFAPRPRWASAPSRSMPFLPTIGAAHSVK